jgi:hypothetical protein
MTLKGGAREVRVLAGLYSGRLGPSQVVLALGGAAARADPAF